MKTLLELLSLTGLLLLCLNAAVVSADVELEYSYNSRILTGVAKNVQQFSGFATKGKLIFRFKGTDAFVKLKEIKTAKINEKLKQKFLEVVKFDYEDPSGPLLEYIKHLEKPIKVVIEGGLVKSFDASADDPYWSINFKKALLAVLQHNRTGIAKEPTSDFYRTYEDSIHGKCETLYETTRIPNKKDPSKTEIRIIKQRFLDKCEDAPKHTFSNVWGFKCSTGELKTVETPLQTTSIVSYVFGDDAIPVYMNGINFIIATPLGTNGENPMSAVNQSLTLISKHDISDENMEIDGETTTYNSLKYSYFGSMRDYDANRQDGHHYNRLVNLQIPDYFEKAHKVFEDILHESLHPNKQQNVGVNKNFITFVRLLIAFSYDDFGNFYEKYASKIEDNPRIKERTLFTDALPIVGTTPAARFIIYLSKLYEELVSSSHKRRMLTQLPFFAKEPTLRLVDELRIIARTPLFSFHIEMESEEVLSAVGTMIFRGCTLSPFGADSGRHFISPEDCSRKVQGLIEDFHKADTVRKQLMFAKAIINTRLMETRQFLLNIINGNYPDLVRRLAMWGVVNTLGEDNDEIFHALSKITRNFAEDYVTRSYAYEILVFIVNDTPYLEQLVYQMMKDPSKQLVSYMYQALESHANSSETCWQSLGNNLKLVLKLLKPAKDMGIFYSGFKTLDFHNEQYDYGRTSQYVWIGNTKGVIPRETYTRQAVSFFGFSIEPIEAGTAIDAEFEIDEMFPDEIHALFKMGLRKKREADPYFDGVKLPFVSRDRKNTPRGSKHLFQPFLEHSDIYFKTFNQYVSGYETLVDFIFANVRKNIHDFQEEKEFFVRNLLFFGDASYDLPNDAGFPISLETKSLAAVGVTVKLHQENKDQSYPNAIVQFLNNINLESVNEGLRGEFTMGVISPLGNSFGYGTIIDTSLRYVLHGSINPTVPNSVVITYKPSTEPYTLLHYKTKPYTFIYNLANLRPNPDTDSVALIKYADESTTRSYSTGEDYFGIGLKATFKYDYYWNDFGSYRSFVKSFFKKQRTYDDYYYWVNRWYAGYQGLIDYAIINPTHSPFEMKVDFQPNKVNPVTEYILTISYKHSVSSPQEENEVKQLDLDEFPVECHCDLNVNLIAKGAVNREWSAQYQTTTTWPGNHLKSSWIRFERSPLPGYDEKPFKLCFRRESLIPKLLDVMNNPVETFKIERTATLQFGENCENDKEVHLKGKFEKTEEQKHLFERPEIKELFNKCKQSVARKHFSSKCWKEASDLFSLRRLSVDLDFKQVTPSIKNFTNRVSSFIRHYLYNNMELNQLGVANPANHIHIETNVSQNYPVADITINKPNENIIYRKLYIPSLYPRYQPFSIIEDVREKYLYNFMQYRPFGSCVVSDNHVQTFDTVEYDIPWTDCPYVIARECGYRGTFSVLAQPIKHPKFSKSIKVFGNDGLEAEIKPDEENQDSLKVTTFKDSKDGINARPYRKGFYDIKVRYYLGQHVIETNMFGLRVLFDGNEITVEASNFYRGKLCGLCGNFDLETTDEFAGPDNCIYEDPKEFSYSYAVPAEGCTVPEFHCPS